MSFYFKNYGIDHTVKILKQKELAESGDALSQCEYGSFLIYDAEGGPKDKLVAEGMKWLHKAEEQGYPPAMHTLACLYFGFANMPGVIRDESKAKKLWIQAASYGEVGAIEMLSKIIYQDEDIVESYAYLKLEKYVRNQIYMSTEINEEYSQKYEKAASNENELKANARFDELRVALEKNQYWLNNKKTERLANMKLSYEKLKEMYANVAEYESITTQEAATMSPELQRIRKLMEKIEQEIPIEELNGKMSQNEAGTLTRNLNSGKFNTSIRLYFSCWWKTALVLLLLQGLLGYLNSGTQGMAVMLGRGLLLSPLHALWIGWIWWSIKK